ncbi:hypothetical protein EDEG_00031 [Edhazardia aedis USNM 41457]|uniref:Uncharacterized protein n=1 Tax=Edhazardia aedis (strain USNM 41457) TaxID=1003232 RepID=J9DJ80_EDHAE|nr:hypothetical protein EDEG_00031 [Edhazardia aedis USNM 41457]|eukprot:EJW01437.1 hypothetical protein EDEG_00031 [Edhazardia aedis USNM 41457]
MEFDKMKEINFEQSCNEEKILNDFYDFPDDFNKFNDEEQTLDKLIDKKTDNNTVKKIKNEKTTQTFDDKDKSSDVNFLKKANDGCNKIEFNEDDEAKFIDVNINTELSLNQPDNFILSLKNIQSLNIEIEPIKRRRVSLNDNSSNEDSCSESTLCGNGILDSDNEEEHCFDIHDKNQENLNYIEACDLADSEFKNNLIDMGKNDTYEIQIHPARSKKCISDVLVKLKNFYADLRKDGHIIEDIVVPSFIWEKLFDYQKESIKWFYELYKKEVGAVLADEMGLGKTLQVIAFLSALYISNKIKFTLIIVPSTLLNQWVTEFKKFFPFLRIILIHKSHTDNISKLFKEITKCFCVVLISYDGYKTYGSHLRNINFDYIVLDEGHKIKNKDSNISLQISRLVCKNKIVLSGTPIQNNLKELWAIFNFVNYGLLGTHEEFVTEYEDPIKNGGYRGATEEVVHKAYTKSRMLRNLIKPFIMRRLKSEVAGELPNKTDLVIFCKLTDIQESLYQKELESEFIYKILIGKQSCMPGLMSLRKICNHPYLFTRNSTYKDDIVKNSGKMKKVDELLQKWRSEGKKALIFTQMIGMIELLEIYMAENDFSYLKMDGKTSLKTREEYIDKFNSDDNIFAFLLTTRVGGLGLNLVGASRIIIYDPDWNPSTDSQAKERAYRYGQEKDVKIYRLIAAGTIEEKIYNRQIFKNMLSQKILSDPKLSKFFEKDDLNELFTYEKPTERIEVMKFIEKKDGLDFFSGGDVSNDLKNKFNRFGDKELLSDAEMIDFIRLREKYENSAYKKR